MAEDITYECGHLYTGKQLEILHTHVVVVFTEFLLKLILTTFQEKQHTFFFVFFFHTKDCLILINKFKNLLDSDPNLLVNKFDSDHNFVVVVGKL